MQLSTLLIIIALGLTGTVFVMFPEARSLAKGFTRLFIKNMAETPEGAEAIFAEKISEAQDRYGKAQDYYTQTAGILDKSQRELKKLHEQFEKVEKQCEQLVSRGEIELAKVKVEERENLILDIRRVSAKVDKYKELSTEAQQVYTLAEKELNSLKDEAKRVVQEMKDNKNITDLYKEMDELRADSGLDKLLAAVREKNEQLAETAAGSKVVHQTKLSTRVESAERKALEVGNNEYLNSLIAKYNKPQIEQRNTFNNTLNNLSMNKERVNVINKN